MLEPVFRAGDTYAIDRDIPREEALAYWLSEHAFVAEADGIAIGTYYIRRNYKGGGSHVCNCGYITARHAEGRGVARAMLTHSLDEARRIGFEAMQFNFVLASNIRAVETWTKAGFQTIGRVPHAFLMPEGEKVDALILHRFL
ncbi:GNAT family N-acetyltransferase [Silicimonas algicola]|uniref:Ribosomal protein S18 acetylase RimI-like enzyme n=2 Tax=Silicimonas algicola TaxID=1826607 RepID=A0A316GBW3_9RHOB|nr:GNAT family N-acetyltransferase [Silicimonas algicola]AZQ69548.1 GNAT family N-acetyltransferase [Silicimonas algicola]PWK58344.1 ribosomal protein S18 acetylase RimI-like enzyme [Silicimonas algicola]